MIPIRRQRLYARMVCNTAECTMLASERSSGANYTWTPACQYWRRQIIKVATRMRSILKSKCHQLYRLENRHPISVPICKTMNDLSISRCAVCLCSIIHCKKYPYMSIAMWARASLFHRFTDTNVYGTGSVKLLKTRHTISVDIRIFFTV